MKRLDYAEVLDLFLWTMDKLTKPTLHNLLAGYDEYAHRAENRQLFYGLERQRLLQRTGHGAQATYRVTASGIQRAQVHDPLGAWNRTWDGAWRVVTFDLPEVRRKDRQNLWRALRARKLGLLQRSVWIWPHPLQPILETIIEAEGVPECFCGFTTRDLFLCTHAEIVASAWDWEAIERGHQTYLGHPILNGPGLAKAHTLAQLSGVARNERRSYAYAFAVDPLLPRSLWPTGYRGAEVHRQHEQFRKLLAKKFAALVM
jgi:DNA-binding transcriptional regulator PaaX